MDCYTFGMKEKGKGQSTQMQYMNSKAHIS